MRRKEIKFIAGDIERDEKLICCVLCKKNKLQQRSRKLLKKSQNCKILIDISLAYTFV